MERYVLSQAARTYLIVALLIGLLLGVGVGWLAKPAPTGVVPQSEYDALQEQLEDVTAERDSAIADRNALQAELSSTVEELNDTLAVIEEMKIALVGVGAEAPIESTITGKVQLGGLFSMSGRLATFGENEYVAASLAAEHVNAFLEAIGAQWTLEIVVEDTEAKTDLALEAVESFAARGIRLLIGPLSSAEIRAIKGYLDANGMLTISQSSTAPDLSIPDDSVFRFCPSDKAGQGPAIGRIMYDDGKRYTITIASNDAWGVGLENASVTKFTQLGGVVLERILYDPLKEEFSAEASLLAERVSAAVDLYGTDEVCVLDISFEEVNALFIAASEYDVLSTVKWYGSDGTAGSAPMVEDPIVLDFTVKVGYPSTIFAPTESAKWDMVRRNGIEVLGRDPESYSYAVYDIVWAYALAILRTDSTDPAVIKEALPEAAGSFFGSSGWIALDENGDREAGDYDIWQIVETSPGTFEWDIIGKYILATDSVEWE